MMVMIEININTNDKKKNNKQISNKSILIDSREVTVFLHVH